MAEAKEMPRPGWCGGWCGSRPPFMGKLGAPAERALQLRWWKITSSVAEAMLTTCESRLDDDTRH